ncbi:MAG: DoxX family protein [Cyanobacteria bacterium REEB446]|jgi:putative oxidoreductase|nr:DoxX family protein [Cyanobacteria bacterium REEB446]
MKNIFQNIETFLSKFQDCALLILRLVLAYGFLIPAINKLQGFNAVVTWFDQSLHLPFPWLITVHGFSQFAAAENGFEIPLYYLVMLFVLISTGTGKYSLDEVFSRKYS